MSDRLNANSCRVLGLHFFCGSLADALELSRKGGLVVAPSGPGLASDLTSCRVYKRALLEADLVLPDSGLMCLWKKWFGTETIKRISGLTFLDGYLKSSLVNKESSFWIMPDEKQAKANMSWLSRNMDYTARECDVYVAPMYSKTGDVEDNILLNKIRESKPATIFIQVGGGVQERLGLFLKNNLEYRPTILCTGAALAFLSGEQVRIPSWIDRFYMGWLLRCFFAPSIYIPRYLKAFRLIYLLAKFGKDCPV